MDHRHAPATIAILAVVLPRQQHPRISRLKILTAQSANLAVFAGSFFVILSMHFYGYATDPLDDLLSIESKRADRCPASLA